MFHSVELDKGRKVGRVTPCAPFPLISPVCGAHGVARPTRRFIETTRAEWSEVVSPLDDLLQLLPFNVRVDLHPERQMVGELVGELFLGHTAGK